MKFGDSMTEVKLLAEDRLLDDHNRALQAKDVVVERTLVGRPMDRISLVTAINCIHAVVVEDLPELRQATEILLRRGHPCSTVHGSYRVAPSQVVSDWQPVPEKATAP